MGRLLKHLTAIGLGLTLLACQQNPFPDVGYYRKEPLKKPEITRGDWETYSIRCIEQFSREVFSLAVQNADPLDSIIEVEVFPEGMRRWVSWKDGELTILSDDKDKPGMHRVHVSATASYQHIPSATTEEMFLYYVTAGKCPSAFLTDEQIRKGVK